MLYIVNKIEGYKDKNIYTFVEINLKKMKQTIFILSVLLGLFGACTNNMEMSDNGRVSKGIIQESNVSKMLRNKNYANYSVNGENVLVFETVEDYAYVLNMISQFSNEEFKRWENEIGFLSYRSVTDSLFENTNDTESLANDYPEYFTLIDGLVETKILSQLEKSIVNTDGIYYIGDIKNKAYEREQICTYLAPGEEVVNEIEIPVKQYRSGGNADYKIIGSCRVLKLKATGATGSMWSFAIEIINRPRSLHMTGWKDTKTACWIEEVKVHMKGLGMNVVKDEYGQTNFVEDQFTSLATKGGESLKILTITYIMSQFMSDPGKLNDPYCVHFRERIGKFGKNGLAVNYYHEAPGITCPHRPVAETQTEIFN